MRISSLRSTAIIAGTLLAIAAPARALGDVKGPPSSRPLSVGTNGTSGMSGATTGFSWVDPGRAGIAFTNRLAEADGSANRVLENGGGVALGDADGDGRPDILFCGLSGNSALYRNLGDWVFRDITAESGLAVAGEQARGAVFVDLDGDRRTDLLVSTLARGVLVFRNRGGGRFVDASTEAGLLGRPGSTTLALADVDLDGDLDLYVARYRADDIRDNANVEARTVGGRTEFHPKYRGRLFMGPKGMQEYGESDSLYLNDGKGRFSEVSWTSGEFLDESGVPFKEPPRDWGLSAAFHDVNGDGWPDLYVCNDYWTPDRFWIGIGSGRFRAAPPEALRQTSENSMGVDFADVDHDGDIDFLVLDMLARDPKRRRRQTLAQSEPASSGRRISDRPQVMRNSFYVNRADGTFAQIADFSGLSASDWSWQPLFLDVDLDGYDDVVVSAGHRKDVQDLDATERVRALQRPLSGARDPEARQRAFARDLFEHGREYPRFDSPLIVFRNRGDLRFEEKTDSWGAGHAGVHQGMASGDLDGDGDLDLVVNRLDDGPALYRNDATAPRIAFRLRGAGANTEAIGAEVRLKGGPLPIMSRQLVSGGRYLAGCDPLVVFGVGSKSNSDPGIGPLGVEVRWPGGAIDRWTGIVAGREYVLAEDAGKNAGPRGAAVTDSPRQGWFEDVSDRVPYLHVENEHDDFTDQPLLPRRPSRSGPGIVWFDVNRDGTDDLIVGAGAGGRIGIFTNDHGGGFRAMLAAGNEAPVARDTTGMVGFMDGSGRPRWVVAHSLIERVATNAAALVDRILGTEMRITVPSWGSSPGPSCLVDFDGDGDLDLFVGGQGMAGRYPDAGGSRMLAQEPGGWRADARSQVGLATLGWVNGAAAGDLDDDGDPDLVVACEWGPIRILVNDGGVLTDRTREWGMDRWMGWWRGIALGDFDGDGKLDIVAGNLGSNGRRRATAGRPATLMFGDFSGRGTVDLVEGEWDPLTGVEYPRHGLRALLEVMPSLQQKYRSEHDFTAVPLARVSSDAPAETLRRAIVTTELSMVFLARSNRFEPEPLPGVAQWAPVWGVAVADFDLDGKNDLVLAQNDFAVREDEPRQDSGEGLVLRGRGDGTFVPLSAGESGLRLTGEQKGVAVADFDGDGRMDLAVGQNSGRLGLFRNRLASAGVRVRFRGPPGNPDGIGVAYGIETPARAEGRQKGADTRLVTAGTGYLSQDSSIAVVPRLREGEAFWVRWPRGERVRVELPAGAKEITVAWTTGGLRSELPQSRSSTTTSVPGSHVVSGGTDKSALAAASPD